MRELELDGWVYPYTEENGRALFDILGTKTAVFVASLNPEDIRYTLRLRHSRELPMFARRRVPHLRLVHSR